jgi:hypothetical protein
MPSSASQKKSNSNYFPFGMAMIMERMTVEHLTPRRKNPSKYSWIFLTWIAVRTAGKGQYL